MHHWKILILCSTFLVSCFGTKHYTEIKFGNGGGFAGSITEYIIKPDGEILINKGFENNFIKFKTIKKKELKEIQKRLSELSNVPVEFNHPGNIYYFLEFKIDNELNKITWGDPKYNEPKEIKELYEYLINIVIHS